MTAETKPKALWCHGDSKAEIRPAQLGEGVLVQTLFSGISRGTESLVFEGRVPAERADRMRCSGQEGEFSFPLKYGYASVGKVLEGELSGRVVFALYPHQDLFRLPMEALHPIPSELPPERAVLAANMETALNIVWDSGAAAGDKVVVIGAGVVGSLVAYLIGKIPGTQTTLVDINPARSKVAEVLGVAFATPDQSPKDCDVVIHASASSEGLALAIESAGFEAKVIEASWFGMGLQSVPLGGAFHDKRLSLISSQVGSIPPSRAPRWGLQRRMGKALELLNDPSLDVLISSESAFDDLGESYDAILKDPATLCHRVRYEN